MTLIAIDRIRIMLALAAAMAIVVLGCLVWQLYCESRRLEEQMQVLDRRIEAQRLISDQTIGAVSRVENAVIARRIPIKRSAN